MLIVFPGSRLKSKTGFSLVELLIALLLGAILISMVSSLYVTSVSSASNSLKYSRLRGDLQSLISVIEADIRRAGYGGRDYLVGIDSDKSVDINDAKNCIVYYYNHDQSLAVEQPNKMAFTLKNNALKFKSGVGNVANNVCAQSNGWFTVSDSQFMAINKLIFTEHVVSNASSTVRNITIDLAGELASNSHIFYSISGHVQVRNVTEDD